ncbi:D-alanine--D-alanine ligase [Candidatus Omnitrophota bacterium]
MGLREDFGRVGVLSGGPSTEREISLKSGAAVHEALTGAGINAVQIEITSDDHDRNIDLIKESGINCAFIALHGYFGEDGGIQGILDEMALPYTGSGRAASRLAMDKVASRRVFEGRGIRVPRYEVFDKSFYKSGRAPRSKLKLPLVVKPSAQGSSLGLTIVKKEDSLERALELAFSFDGRAVAEEYVDGREITAGILDEKPLPIVEIIPENGVFDFEAKYQPGSTRYVVPAQLTGKLTSSAQEAGLSAHKSLGCRGCSRVDMILGEEGIVYVLEVNTIPGFTETSLLPKAAKSAGCGFGELCLKLIELAYEKTKN